MSLSPELQDLWATIQAVEPSLRRKVFPKVPHSWIKQLWGPIVIHCFALAALLACLVYLRWFAETNKLSFFKIFQIRSTSVPIPTIDVYIPLAAIFSVISIVTQALTLQGAYTGEGHVENIVGCLYSGYFPIALASWLLAGSLLHNSAEMFRVRKPHSFKMPRPIVLISELYILPAVFILSAGGVLIAANSRVNTSLATSHEFVKMVGSVRPNPSAEEVQFLGSLLAKLDTQTRNAQNLEKVLFIEYLCWLIGFMILIPTSIMMIKTFKKFMDIELNATSTAEHSKVPKGGPSGSAARNQRYAQLQLRYRFWIWLSIFATIWTAMFAAIMVYSFVMVANSGSTSTTAIVVQLVSHWINACFGFGIAAIWFMKSIMGSTTNLSQSAESAAPKGERRVGTDTIKVQVETTTRLDGPPDELYVALDGMPPTKRRTSSEAMCDFFSAPKESEDRLSDDRGV